MDKPHTLQVMNKSLNCVEWCLERNGEDIKLLCGGAGGSIFVVAINSSGDLELQSEAPKAHSDQVRDIKCCPSILTKKQLVLSIADDKTIVIWQWDANEISQHHTIDIGKGLFRAAWSFTGHLCFVASVDGVLVLKLDKERENVIEV